VRRRRSPSAGNTDIPYGYCQCGCGEQTTLAPQSDTRRGVVNGEPKRYLPGHNNRGRRLKDPYELYTIEDRGHTTACWIWHGGSTPLGYGRIRAGDRSRVGGRLVPAHRWFYEDAGHIIPTGLLLDHLCCVPACVNPAHLEPVCVAENAQRGRGAKLTPAQVEQIRVSEARTAVLAAEYGMSPEQIRNIRGGRSWANA